MQLDSTTRDSEYENAEAQVDAANDRLQKVNLDYFISANVDPDQPGEVSFVHDGEEFARLHWSECRTGLERVVVRVFASALEKL